MCESPTWRRSEGECESSVGAVEAFGRLGRMEEGQDDRKCGRL